MAYNIATSPVFQPLLFRVDDFSNDFLRKSPEQENVFYNGYNFRK